MVAAAGAIVAKHGNRSVSSTSGSADILEAAGINLNISSHQVEQCIKELGIGFMFAPLHHSAMKHAIGPRKEMGIRTMFNLLGDPDVTRKDKDVIINRSYLKYFKDDKVQINQEKLIQFNFSMITVRIK